MAKEFIKTTCKVGACEPQCGLTLEIEDGVLRAVQPDTAHPISQGYMCLKANAVPEYQNRSFPCQDRVGVWCAVAGDKWPAAGVLKFFPQ